MAMLRNLWDNSEEQSKLEAQTPPHTTLGPSARADSIVDEQVLSTVPSNGTKESGRGATAGFTDFAEYPVIEIEQPPERKRWNERPLILVVLRRIGFGVYR
ncbi:MAG: hypothetical protein Q9203_004676 [Teloschistes exilis]